MANKKLNKKIFGIISALALMLFTACTPGQSPSFLPNTPDDTSQNQQIEDVYENTVTVLNVGQASCVLIQTGGQYILLDAGYGGGDTDILTYLNERGVDKISLMVLSHFHSDHTSQVLSLLRNFEVDALLIPNLSMETTPTTSFYETLLDKAGQGEFEIFTATQGKPFDIGSGRITVLADTINNLGINSTSTCISFSQNDFIYLFTGDMESKGEAKVLDILPQNVSLFSAAHHGSSDSNSAALLERIKPQYIAISCGENNKYGHPRKEVISLFKEKNIPYIITHEYGNIVYSMDKNCLQEGVH